MSTKERKALGRGFSALLKPVEELNTATSTPSSSEPTERNSDPGYHQIEIAKIRLNPKQPRLVFNDESLEELSQSIQAKGVIQPILVRRIKEGEQEHLELVAGERRLRASKLAGFDRIPAIVREIKDVDLLEVALIENIQRDNLNPIEEALAYQNLLKEHGYKQEDLAKRVGKNRATIANLLRLLKLSEEHQDDISKNRISAGHARCLLSIEDTANRNDLRDIIIKDDLSVRDAEKWAKNSRTPTKPTTAKKAAPMSAQTIQNQERLQNLFKTKVIIKEQGEKGKIEIDYFNEEDFNRVYALLMQIPR